MAVKKIDMACTLTPIESTPCTVDRHVVTAFSNDVETYKDYNQVFYFDSDNDRRYWQTDVSMYMVECMLKHTAESGWVWTWRAQLDKARRNYDWNFDNRHLIKRGYERAKPTFVMGKPFPEAFEVLAGKFLEILSKEHFLFKVSRLAYIFKPVNGYLYVDEDHKKMLHLYCEVQI